MAATWTPYDVSVAPPPPPPLSITWAALDCPDGWASDIDERPMVLGGMTLQDFNHLPGDRRALRGRRRGVVDEGNTQDVHGVVRPRLSGGLRATAEHVWIAIDPKDFPS